MKTQQTKGQLIKQNPALCKLYQQIDQFVQHLDKLPDSGEVRENKPVSVPQAMLPMVF